jgi:hypothetical protein
MTNSQRNNDFIVSLAGINIDTTIINIEEMAGYCRERGRLANVVTKKKTYEHIDPISYSLIMNYKKPMPRVVTVKNKPFADVYKIIGERFANGLIIAESDTISESITDDFCKNKKWEENDIDIMVCKSFASLSIEEARHANFLRISADPDFDMAILLKIGEHINKHAVGTILIAQAFVNNNYNQVVTHMEEQIAKYEGLGMNDFVDYSELNRQLSYFAYIDLDSGKILNIDRQVIKEYLLQNYKNIMPTMPEDKIPGYVDLITLE